MGIRPTFTGVRRKRLWKPRVLLVGVDYALDSMGLLC